MPINQKRILKPSNFFVISGLINCILFIFSTQLHAQTVPIGFYEGLMGNSGVAISDSSASSFYNPSLILNKNKNSYSMGGNTLSNFNSDATGDRLTSTSISPSYLSSLQIFEGFAHEFFLTNITSIDAQVLKFSASGAETHLNIRGQDYLAGYTFAFHALPWGFQFNLRYRDHQTSGFSEFQNSAGAETSDIQSASRQIDLVQSIGGNHQFGNYRLGYKYMTRGLALYKKKEGHEKKYSYSQTLNQYTKTESDFLIEQDAVAEVIVIGHGFKINDHEFLTDTKLEELSDLTHAYNWSQTFGYKLSSAAGYQYMCGLSHLINKDIKYLGQSMYISTGFSWQVRSSRTAIGIYYNVDKLKYDTQIYGLTFSSELIY
jgi:hypothetical protein